MYWTKDGKLDHTKLPDLLPEEVWLERRKHGLGASDVAAIAGLHKYMAPSDVYMEKVGLVEHVPDNDFMWWGREEEPLIIKKFHIETGKHVFRCATRNFVHPEYPWAMATPDGLMLDEVAGFEAKEAGPSQAKRWGTEWTDEAPEEYICQCQWGMFITGAEKWYLVVKINRKLQKYVITRDDNLINGLFERAKWFWEEHIQKEEIPPPDGSEAYSRLLGSVYHEENKDIIPYDAETYELAEKLIKYNREMEALKKEMTLIEDKIKVKIGTNHGIDLGDLGHIIWPEVPERVEFDDKTFMKENRASVISLMARELNVPVNVLEQRYMRKRPGYRTFRKYLKEEEVE